ncbi:MAG: DUF47 domain-containing protein [Candidatus Tectomicrobia bacterium]|nr:DUF47 domain-containing protein [Candidatus Tectomicrobia bacterium]
MMLKDFLKKFLSRNEEFFDIFEQVVANISEGMELLQRMLKEFQNLPELSKAIKEVEHKGDELTHQAIIRLNLSFITPFDREDIYNLVARLDDILDGIEAVAERLVIFKVEKPREQETMQFASGLLASVEELAKMVKGLRDLKNAKAILRSCVEVNRLENEGDSLLRQGLANLFEQEADPFEVIKWKEIYELLETITDRCEDVANIIEGVVLKYS